MTLPTIGSSATSIVYPASAVLPGFEMSHRLIRIGLDMLFAPIRLKRPVPGASAATAIAKLTTNAAATLIFKTAPPSQYNSVPAGSRDTTARFTCGRSGDPLISIWFIGVHRRLTPFAPPAQLASQ